MHPKLTTVKKGGVLVVAALLTAHLAAQEPTFRSTVDMVLLNVAVTDQSGRQILGLGSQDFSIFENGRKQNVQYFQQSDVPLSVMLLIDVSDSMSSSLPLAQKAATGFVRTLRPHDLVSVVPFETRMHNPLPFTSDMNVLEQSIRQTKAKGSTALFDAVYVSLKQLREAAHESSVGGQPRRQAILLLTDGYDSTSLTTFDDAVDAASRSDAAIYAIRLPGSKSAPERLESPQFVLGRFAQKTGGRVYLSDLPTQLPEIYRKIKSELETQYLIAYRSDDVRLDGGFRQVTVRMEKPGLSARTRPGYFAAAAAAAAATR
jgi:VWFA-related protein